MNETGECDGIPEAIRHAAAAWVLRCDRGLNAAEQDEFSQWLAADPRHGEELARHRRHWDRLNTLAEWRPEHSAQPNPDLLAPPWRRVVRRLLPISMAVAAVFAVLLYVDWPAAPSTSPDAGRSSVMKGAKDQLTLQDGSVIQLNGNAAVTVLYAKVERRVRLDQGEAHFTVTADSRRPFIVTARGIDVVAVGTAFNVRVAPATVEVLVTEGRVRVDANRPEVAPGRPVHRRPSAPVLVPILEARQQAVLAIRAGPEPVSIATLTVGEVERSLAWQHRLLEFSDATLTEIVAEFNRRNVVQIVVLDAELASLRISVSFRSDNIDGFLRLLEAGFGAQTERAGELEIHVHRSR